MQNQYHQLLLQVAESRRIHGVQERDGTVHQVWRQNGEQKIRVNIGLRPDGSPWLTPWLKTEDHHGSRRVQHKWHVGMNVKVSTIGSDLSQATVKPHGENQNHPEPDHADDYNETTQYARHRTRIGPDFSEHWLAQDDSNQNLSRTLGVLRATIGGQKDTDPDKSAVVLVRSGAKPQQQQQQQNPWDGPPPTGGTPQKRHLTYAGNAGNVPTQSGDAVVTQFDKNVKTEHTAQAILQKIQSADGAMMPVPDGGSGSAIQTTFHQLMDGTVTRSIINTAMGTITTMLHKNGDVTHSIEDGSGNISTVTQQATQIIHQMQGSQGFSLIVQQAEQITHQVGGSILQILSSAININSSEVNVNGNSIGGYSSPPASPELINGTGVPLQFPVMWEIGASLVVEEKTHA